MTHHNQRFQTRRVVTIDKVATCYDCGWSITSDQVKRPNYVGHNARDHAMTTGHTVDVVTTRTTTYTALHTNHRSTA